MILADTSVWVRHFREGDSSLTRLLEENLLLIHPFIIGELACGNLKNRQAILTHLLDLPMAPTAENNEVMHLIEQKRLHGKGLGWVDMHLVASVLLSHAKLWTLDLSLRTICSDLSCDYVPHPK